MAGEASTTEAATYPRGFSRDTDWKWPMVPARKLVTLNYGRALKADTRSPGKVPVFGTNGQCGWHDAALAKAPGLILGRKGQGPLGVEWCDKDFWVIDTAYYASTLTPDIDLKYLYHLVKYVGLNHLKDGTSNPTLSRDTFGAQLFPLPPLAEQKAIAAVLGALDDKIELNRRMNATLEALARALFQSWFVDFDPVRAKLDGRPPANLDPATAALFPATFDETTAGHIPHGWRVGSIYEIANVIYGAPFASSLFNSEKLGKPLIRIRDLPNESPAVFTTEMHPKGYLLQPGDIAVGMDGEFRAYLWAGVESWLNQRVCVFAPKPGYSAAFVRNSIIAPLAQVEATETATTVIHLGKNDIDRFTVIIPDASVAEAFKRQCQPWYDQIVANKQQSRTLATLRDTLLPKLLSGELSVAEREN